MHTDHEFLRAEIRDLCAWLRLIVNNEDDPAFVRAVTTPKRGIGHQTLQSLGQFASQYKLSLFEALFSNSLGSVLSARRQHRPQAVAEQGFKEAELVLRGKLPQALQRLMTNATLGCGDGTHEGRVVLVVDDQAQPCTQITNFCAQKFVICVHGCA